MKAETLWEARRDAATAALRTQAKHHTDESLSAKGSVIYMDGCPPAEGIHPAIALVEKVHSEARAQDALFHQGQAQKYLRAIETIKNMTYEENN